MKKPKIGHWIVLILLLLGLYFVYTKFVKPRLAGVSKSVGA